LEELMSVAGVRLHTPDDENTVEAVERARLGQADAIRYLWARYGDALCEELERRGAQREHARALALTAFCDLPQSLAAFRRPDISFLEWIVGWVLASRGQSAAESSLGVPRHAPA
jgi:hypothetical protein